MQLKWKPARQLRCLWLGDTFRRDSVMAFEEGIVTILIIMACAWWLWRNRLSRVAGRSGAKAIPLLPERCTLFAGHIAWLLQEGKKTGGLRFMPLYCAFMKHKLPVFSLRIGPPFRIGPIGRKIIIVNDSSMAEEIVKSKDFGLNAELGEKLAEIVGGPSIPSLDGAKWKHRRRLIEPIFRRDQLESALEVINRHTSSFLEDLELRNKTCGGGSTSVEEASQAAPVDLTKILPNLVMDIIAEVGFGYNVHEQPEEKLIALRQSLNSLLKQFSISIYYPSMTLYRILHRRRYQEFLGRREFFKNELIYSILKKRRDAIASGEDTPLDLLSLLLSARDEDSPTGEGLTEEEVVNEAFTLFGAGYETMASSLKWTLYYMAKHPDIQERVYDELSRVTSEENLTSCEAVGKLTYLSWVIKEAQRLAPAATFLGRGALRDTVVQGYHFPAGSDATICSYNIHHSPNEWDDPEEFKPERWEKVDGGCKKSSGYSFLAFGAGARRCIGQPLAVPAMKLVSALFVNKFCLVLADKDCKPMMPFTYQPGQVLVYLEPR